MGKRLDGEFFFDEETGGHVEGCSYVLATDVEMRTLDGFAFTSWAAGYGDLVMAPDLSTIRRIPWHDRTALVMCDVLNGEGRPVEVAPRQVLRRQLEALEQVGWTAHVGTELEFMVFTQTYEDAWTSGYRGLTPANLYNVDYSLQGTARIEDLLGRVRRGMKGAGMVVESLKGECNLGQHEIAFKYSDALDKCDEHSLYKLGAKEIAAQAGCSLTFMAKYDQREGNSCHVHLSLTDPQGHNVLSGDRAHGFSTAMEGFLAGLLAYLGDYTVLLAPNINSYKRFVEGFFAPTTLAWGLDNRTCALRVVGHGPSLRVECRIPGGDVNPYLAVAALLASGLRGVEQNLELEEPVTGNAYALERSRVPTSLVDALRLFRASEVVREALGDEVVEHYARAAEVEIEAFGAAVTDWERVRGFERL
jgi:glutamine synthetase